MSHFLRSYTVSRKLLLFLALTVGFALCGSQAVYAQISHGGQPYSFTHAVQEQPPVVTMGAVDAAALRAEDRAAQQQDRPVPFRFGKAFEVSLGLSNAGVWTALPDGGRLWRLRVATQGAYSVNLIFDRFHLPPGGRLFIYNQDKSMVLGAFTEENNKPYGRFSTLPLEGSVITLEYFEPKAQRGETKLRVEKVIHAYRDLFVQESGVTRNGFGDSGSCNINVNCPEGNTWQDEKRAAAMILVEQGTRWCSGALVNNEREDLTPYFLSANHCYTEDPTGGGVSDWVFWFNYESTSCSDPSTEPGHDGVSGAYLRARNSASDFLLVELTAKPPGSYNTYYAGWSAVNTPAQSSVTIHHPQGDIKKISLDDDSAVSDRWQTRFFTSPPNSHWRAEFDDGTVEKGSSGAPLFDQNHRIVGQLQGNLNYYHGVDFCTIPQGWYGKFSMSWDYGNTASTRLKDWLDPDNTGIQTLDGMAGPVPPLVVTTINGPAERDPGEMGMWSVGPVYGGLPPYSYSWFKSYYDGSQFVIEDLGTGTYVSTSNQTSFNIVCDVTDQRDNVASAHIFVDVDGPAILPYGVEARSRFASASPKEAVATSGAVAQSTSERRPEAFALKGNAPNPFSTRTKIHFVLPEAAHVTLEVYDVMGRKVATLVDQQMEPGFHHAVFDSDKSGLPSGIYLYRFLAGDFVDTGRMVVVR